MKSKNLILIFFLINYSSLVHIEIDKKIHENFHNIENDEIKSIEIYYTFPKSSCGHSYLIKKKIVSKIFKFLNENGIKVSHTKAFGIDENFKNNEIFSYIKGVDFDFSIYEFNVFIKINKENNSTINLIGSSDIKSKKYNKMLHGDHGYSQEEEIKKIYNTVKSLL